MTLGELDGPLSMPPWSYRSGWVCTGSARLFAHAKDFSLTLDGHWWPLVAIGWHPIRRNTLAAMGGNAWAPRPQQMQAEALRPHQTGERMHRIGLPCAQPVP